MADEITVSIYDASNKYQLFYDGNRFEIEQYDKTNKKWFPTNQDPDVLFSQIDTTPKNLVDLACILDSIKPEYHKAVSEYEFRKVAMLSILHRSPGFLDILKDAPVIGVLLADSYGKGKLNLDLACELVYKPRSEIVKAVGARGTKSQVKLLTKMHFEYFENIISRKVNKLLGNHSMQRAISKIGLKFVDEDLMDYIASNEAMMDFKVIRHGIESYYGHNPNSPLTKSALYSYLACTKHLLWETIQMIDEMGDRNKNMTGLLKCPTPKCVSQYHNRIHAKYELHRMRELLSKYKTFPSPPMSGNNDIKPITSLNELIKESCTMNHCSSSYAEAIYLGNYYVYKVLRPERATLGISIKESRYLSIDQLKLTNNRKASDETWAIVKEWFES